MSAKADSRLTIAKLDSQYELALAEVWPLQRELDRIASKHLPQLLAKHGLPQIDPNYAIYRIRRINIDLSINRDAINSDKLPQLWAQQILQAVFHELRYGDSNNVVRFVDYADFAAAFIIELLRGTAWKSWEFEEFAALQHLSTAQAITELLCSRPRFVFILARQLAKQRMIDTLYQTLEERQAKRVWQALEHEFTPKVQASHLLNFGKQVFTASAMLSIFEASVMHQRLFFFLQTIALQAIKPENLNSLIGLSRHVAIVHNNLLRLKVGARQTLQKLLLQPYPDFSAAGKVLPADIRNLYLFYQGQDNGPEYVRWLLRRVIKFTPGLNIPETPEDKFGQTELEIKPTEDITEFYSAFAGFSLLLMSIRDLKLYIFLNKSQLRQCLLAMLDDKFYHLFKMDPFLGTLFPAEEMWSKESPWPIVEESLLQDLNTKQKKAVENAKPADAWAQLLLHRFSKRLPGMEASSLAYLRQQFLQRSGHVCLTQKSLTISLEPLPLGIVLKMAGLSGWQGQLPWLDNRELTIKVPTG